MTDTKAILRKSLVMCVLVLSAAGARGELDSNKPSVGYLYPAGAQRGTTVQIIAGGQFLRGAKEVYISGEGVVGTVVKHMRPPQNLNSDQRRELNRLMKEARNKRLSELPQKVLDEILPKGIPEEKPKESDETEEPVKMPNHPLLTDIESQSLQELAHTAYTLYFPRNKLQLNRQLGEMVLIELKIAPDAAPGDRQLRVRGNYGLSNPIIFQVGMLPEVRELEPNNGSPYFVNNVFRPISTADLEKILRVKPYDTPVLINGQIMPGDIDRFKFRAKEGEQLVIETQARSLIPYLADAVPGWFQATVSLYDKDGKEVAYADDYRFNPDPVLFYEIDKSGEYQLEIRDSIYRGREDFVYRVSIGQQPFITQAFPLGGKQGTEVVSAIDGKHLPRKELKLDTSAGGSGIRKAAYVDENAFSNSIPYAVDHLPECIEEESNDTIKKAQAVSLPVIVNGRIGAAGDVDVFEFKAKAGQSVVAEVSARRLNSPVDSLVRITDASGKVVAWNDDHVLKDKFLHKDVVGLVTHHADSYLMATLPDEGVYYVHLADSQGHGGDAYAYRLRISQPQPDFALRVTPSSISTKPGMKLPVSVHVMRQDGFDGEIIMRLDNAPKGFKLEGARVPAGCDRVTMTLTAPPKAPDGLVTLNLSGLGQVEGEYINRSAVAADDVMQAFLYRHLVPCESLLVHVNQQRWRIPDVDLLGKVPVEVPVAGAMQVKLKTPKRDNLKEILLELYKPPAGVTISDVKVVEEGLAFEIKADDSVEAGFEDNLIIESIRQSPIKDKEGNLTGKTRRSSLGVVPAIPIKIVARADTEKKVAAQGLDKSEAIKN